MPETSVDENDGLVLRQYNIRISRQFSDLNPIAQTAREKILPHNHLRLCILSLDSRHIPAPLFGCLNISHIVTTKLITILLFVNTLVSIKKIFCNFVKESSLRPLQWMFEYPWIDI